MSNNRRAVRALILILLALGACLLAACVSKSRMPYEKGMRLFEAHNYGGALAEFEKSLAADPQQKMALFYKARCLYELDRYKEAMPDFEEFLKRTESDQATFDNERYDAAFYRDKCKEELGIEVPQNKEAIPPPRMGD